LTTGGKPAKDSERIAVVLDHTEKKVLNQMKVLKTLYNDKEERLNSEKKKRVGTFIKKMKEEEERKFKKQKEARKLVSRTLSQAQAKRERFESSGKGKKRKRE
jgi:hypothetical protein